MSATVEQVDLDAIERDCEHKIGELRKAVSRLSLDAMTDPEVRNELVGVERELAEVETERHRVDLARAEQERRDADARQKALDARQQAAYRAAQKLQPGREQAAAAVDEAAEEFVRRIADFTAVCRKQQAALIQAGQPQVANIARPRGFLLEATLAKALTDARWAKTVGPGLWERLPLIPLQHQKPLVESDAHPVEPPEGK